MEGCTRKMEKDNSLGLLEKISKRLNWFTLEFDFTQEENPNKHLDEIINTIKTKSNYEPYGIFEDMKRKGLYHIYCRKKQNA